MNISLHSFEDGNNEDYVKYICNLATFAKTAANVGIIVVFRLWNKGFDDDKNQTAMALLKEYIPGDWVKNTRGIRIRDKMFLELGERFEWPDINAETTGYRFSCQGLTHQIGILADGTVVPCCLDSDGIINLGNIFQEDLETILPCKPNLILLPKTCSATDVLEADAYMTQLEQELGMQPNTVALMPLIETAMGVENAFAIASATSRVKALFLGAEDLTADLQCKRTKEGREIEYARTRLVVAARAAGVDVYDTPFTDVNDDEGIVTDAKLAKALGFTGKASISPRHVEVINQVVSGEPSKVSVLYHSDYNNKVTLKGLYLNGTLLQPIESADGKQVYALDAPVEISSMRSFSAALPPRSTTISSSISFLDEVYLSSLGILSVNPPALPLGIIEIC